MRLAPALCGDKERASRELFLRRMAAQLGGFGSSYRDGVSGSSRPVAFVSAEGIPRQFQIVLTATVLQVAAMKARSTISASEIWLGALAIRLAALVLTGSILLVLPRQPVGNDRAAACLLEAETGPHVAPKTERLRLSHAALGDMLLHD